VPRRLGICIASARYVYHVSTDKLQRLRNDGVYKLGGNMDAQALIIWLIVGAIAGWLAGMVVKGGGYGLIGDIIVGIVGGLIAGWLLPQIGIVIGGGIIAAIINAFIGAVILLIILRLVRRAA